MLCHFLISAVTDVGHYATEHSDPPPRLGSVMAKASLSPSREPENPARNSGAPSLLVVTAPALEPQDGVTVLPGCVGSDSS